MRKRLTDDGHVATVGGRPSSHRRRQLGISKLIEEMRWSYLIFSRAGLGAQRSAGGASLIDLGHEPRPFLLCANVLGPLIRKIFAGTSKYCEARQNRYRLFEWLGPSAAVLVWILRRERYRSRVCSFGVLLLVKHPVQM